MRPSLLASILTKQRDLKSTAVNHNKLFIQLLKHFDSLDVHKCNKTIDQKCCNNIHFTHFVFLWQMSVSVTNLRFKYVGARLCTGIRQNIALLAAL